MQVVPRWAKPSEAERQRGVLGSLRVQIELEQPQEVTTLRGKSPTLLPPFSPLPSLSAASSCLLPPSLTFSHLLPPYLAQVELALRGLSLSNATLGSMPLRSLHLRGRGGRLLAQLRLDVEGGTELAHEPSKVSERVRGGGAGLYLTLEVRGLAPPRPPSPSLTSSYRCASPRACHVHGTRVACTCAQRLSIEDTGFELDAASRRQFDALLAGSGALLSARLEHSLTFSDLPSPSLAFSRLLSPSHRRAA